jgi:hypothetical protein
MGWFREYRWLVAFGGSHEEYLNTPLFIIERLLAVDDQVKEAEADAIRRAK